VRRHCRTCYISPTGGTFQDLRSSVKKFESWTHERRSWKLGKFYSHWNTTALVESLKNSKHKHVLTQELTNGHAWLTRFHADMSSGTQLRNKKCEDFYFHAIRNPGHGPLHTLSNESQYTSRSRGAKMLKATKILISFRSVVFNLFHAATHFATQFNLTTPFRKFPIRRKKRSCICTVENHND